MATKKKTRNRVKPKCETPVPIVDNGIDIERVEDDIKDLEKADRQLKKALNAQTEETISLKVEVRKLRKEQEKRSDFWNKIIAVTSIITCVISAIGLFLKFYKT